MTTKIFTLNRATQSHEGHTPFFVGVLSRMSRFVRDKEGQKSRIVPLSRMSRCADSPRKSLNLKEPTMKTLIQYFTDKLVAALRFFRRPVANVVAAEPDRADGHIAPVGPPLNWLAPPSGPAKSPEEILRSWDVAFGVDHHRVDDANDAANPTLH